MTQALPHACGVRTRLPTVSVVIPCYRYGQYLAACLSSVTQQDGVDVDVLIIDDASGDGSADIARALAAQDRRVTVVEHTENRGHLATYDEGLSQVAGEFAVLLSADDMLVPGSLARAVALMREHPRVGFVYGRSVYFAGKPPRIRTGKGRNHVWPGHEWVRRRFREATNVISSPEVVMRSSVLREVGGFRPNLQHAGDLELWLRMAARADVGYVRGADQALYRRHPSSMSRATYGTHLADLQQRRGVFDALLADTDLPLPDVVELHGLACRTLARQALRRACRAYDRRRVDSVPVDELVEFAESVCPSAHDLPEWYGLRLRRAFGPRVMPWLQPLILTALAHRVRTWLWWQSWRRRGV